MSVHGYPLRAVAGDYLGAGFGLALTGGLLLLTPPGPAMTAVLGVLFALFVVHGLRAGCRHLTRIEVGEERIASRGPRPGVLVWKDLSGVKLAYYSIRRDGSDGWLQLDLSGGRVRLGLDSGLDGFPVVAARAAAAVAANGLRLDAVSAENFAALDIAGGGARR